MQKFSHSPMIWAGLIASALFLAGCGSSTPETSNTTGTVSTFLSDPPTCAAPAGPFLNVWVTITRVRAHISSNANGDSDGWVDLVNLEDAPRQIDLLSLAPDSPTLVCLLNQLGQTSGLPPGNYQQIRIHLLPNDAPGDNVTPQNNCASVSANNCVNHATMNTQPLLLNSQDINGIKIPPGRIAGGAIQLVAGESADINIDFNACSSIVFQGPNAFRLKPTLHAGEVSINDNENGISGRVLAGEVVGGQVVPTDPASPISGAIVLLEQPDPNDATINRVIRSGLTGSDGQFIFCPLPSGDYDVVVAAAVLDPGTMLTTTYNATIAFGVPVGTNLGDIPLVPEEPSTAGSTDPATLMGEVTTDATGTVPVTVSPLQDATFDMTTVKVTLPVFEPDAFGQPPTFPSGDNSCSVGNSCVKYELMVPASNPSVGVFDAGGFTYAEPAGAPVPYFVNAQSDACTPTDSATTTMSVDVTPGGTATPGVLALAVCTPP